MPRKLECLLVEMLSPLNLPVLFMLLSSFLSYRKASAGARSGAESFLACFRAAS
jgi:di/tricarboxylate transporter